MRYRRKSGDRLIYLELSAKGCCQIAGAKGDLLLAVAVWPRLLPALLVVLGEGCATTMTVLRAATPSWSAFNCMARLSRKGTRSDGVRPPVAGRVSFNDVFRTPTRRRIRRPSKVYAQMTADEIETTMAVRATAEA
jgi:hypothetical protein